MGPVLASSFVPPRSPQHARGPDAGVPIPGTADARMPREVDETCAEGGRPCPAAPAPVPGWVDLVRVAEAAAAASEPPATFGCRVRWGRIVWTNVRGPRSFGELLWALEELSATLCELCGAPAAPREGWDGAVRTLCPRHRVEVTTAGPRVADLYERAWCALGEAGSRRGRVSGEARAGEEAPRGR